MSHENKGNNSISSKAAEPVRVRIAPSPTGDPHVGTAYIGLLNYVFAKQRGGKFILRIEDTDRTRFVASSEQMIFDALRWVGLQWDEGPDVGGPHGPYRQSERTGIYREYCQILIDNGTAYRAFETADELDAERKAQMAAKQAPKYAGASRNYTAEQAAALVAEGKPYTIRLRVPDGDKGPGVASTTFRDELRGDITFDHNNVDDQVLLKSDGFPTYHLANVVDDHLMGITDVIRAEEWISSTPKHVLLYRAFGWNLPRFWHMPLLRNTDKSKISKRKNPVSLIYYRQAGFLPQAMLNFLGLMGGGMAQPTEQEIVNKGLDMKLADIFSLDDMQDRFDFARISLGGPVFDLVKLKWMNGEYLRKQSPDEFFAALRQTIFSDDYLRAIAPLVQTRIETLGQFGDMTGFFFADNVMPTQEALERVGNTQERQKYSEYLLTALESSDWTVADIDYSVRATADMEAFTSIFRSDWEKLMHKAALLNFTIYKGRDPKNFPLSEPSLEVYEESLMDSEVALSEIASRLQSLREFAKFQATTSFGVKQKFSLLRLILTGKTASPPLLESLVVFGKARSLDRVRRFVDAQKKIAALAGRGK